MGHTLAVNLNTSKFHIEHRVITSGYTVSLNGRSYQLARDQVHPGMRHQTVRLEITPGGELQASYEGRPIELSEHRKPRRRKGYEQRKAPNAGGKSTWGHDLLRRPSPPSWLFTDRAVNGAVLRRRAEHAE